ncbi:hypothetical protein ACN38_g6905 [Penicillium nordicum]|uniref:Uncharacterized protein n=1 Tax=Penicillium nordicum TaxID=229535 RepID=A0A0M8P2K6_9EURO|nr:hypothetical protein ACN38_g6905 [Penicillium nordicum]
MKNKRYRGCGTRLMFGSKGSLVLRSQMLAGASVSPVGRGRCDCDSIDRSVLLKLFRDASREISAALK